MNVGRMLGRVALGVGVLAGWAMGQEAGKAPRPNVVVILADDMGYSDIGCYGGEIRTPNIDRLASEGVRFTQMYNTARCCPTRAALLTGLYSHQAGVGHMTADDGLPGYRGHLNDSCVTIAEVMRSAGYQTFMSGKWHVGAMEACWPTNRGFDHYFGVLSGGTNYFGKSVGAAKFTEDGKEVTPGEGFYFTDAITDYAMKQVEGAVKDKSGKPFFLYMAYTSPHWPMQAPKEDIERYKGKYDMGWDVLRQQRHERQVKMGLIDPKWEMIERNDAAEAWDSSKEQATDARRMEIYAAMVDRMDQNVGRFMGKLKEIGAEKNTVVMFLADNGGNYEHIRRSLAGAELGTADSFESYDAGWGGASNTPFRRYKHHVHEGGISTPLVVWWPGRVKAGSVDKTQIGHVVDLMPTCAELGGAVYPKERAGKEVPEMAGVSLVSAFEGKDVERGPVFWEHEGNKAVREGKWKIVTKGEGPWELYDVEADRGEMKDLASEQPERVKKMVGEWEAWAKKVGAVDWKALQKGRAKGKKKGAGQPAGVD